MKIELICTASMSKRLIARGVAHHPVVTTAFRSGNIGICRGTTATYVAEEFLGQLVEHFAYTTGLTLPPSPTPAVEPPEATISDIIIRRGTIHMDGETVIEAAQAFTSGDVIVKGANALNYAKGVAGCLVGHPTGGTVGGFWGPLWGRKLRLVIPVGLEKEIGTDITEVSAVTIDDNSGPALMPMRGIIITEIEAIGLLTGAQAYQIAAGGIRGAEGAVRLLIEGDEDALAAVERLAGELKQEPPF